MKVNITNGFELPFYLSENFYLVVSPIGKANLCLLIQNVDFQRLGAEPRIRFYGYSYLLTTREKHYITQLNSE